MAIFEDLVQHQDETGKELGRVLANFKKDSLARKTADYLDSRLNQLTELWEAFAKADHELKEFESTHSDHPYFANKYFRAVEHQYLKAKEAMLQLRYTSKSGTTEPQTESEAAFIPFKTSLAGSSDLTILIRQQRSKMNAVEHIIRGINSNEAEKSKPYCDMKSAVVTRYWEDIRRQHETIGQCTADPTTCGYTDDEFNKIEERIQDALVLLAMGVEKHNAIAASSVLPQQPIKLPQITVPMFDGDYSKWKSFHDLFKQIVHKQQIGNAQKMWYLKTSLTGEAERLIRHMPISDENYSTAWDMLNNRYSNTRLMVSAFLDKLLSQPTIVQESASAIKKMHDVTTECLLGLNNLEIDVTNWDPMILHLLIRKLDKTSHNLYEQSLKAPRELQGIDAFLEFLERRFQALETVGAEKRSIHYNKLTSNKCAALVSVKDVPIINCKVCKGTHKVSACQEFKQLSIPDRINKIKQLSLCINCLRDGHRASQCTSRKCLKCEKRHNTLLHLDHLTASANDSHARKLQQGTTPSTLSIEPSRGNDSLATLSTEWSTGGAMVLLSTAIIQTRNHKGVLVDLRAVLDSGSQMNIITEGAVSKLGLQQKHVDLNIRGIGGNCQQARNRVSLRIHSKVSNFTAQIDAMVLPQIISAQPAYCLGPSTRQAIPRNIKLADPTFDQPGQVDLLIGAEIFYELLSIGQIRLAKELPLLQNTAFGWVVAGKLEGQRVPNITCAIAELDEQKMNEQIERFWRLEEPDNTDAHMTTQEVKCETDFVQNTKRTHEGRFVVKLPFKKDPQQLGSSKEIALRRFLQLERRLSKDPALQQQYCQFMNEYETIGHMSEIDPTSVMDSHYILPHHCVLKPESTTTKLRVVFDASAKTENGISLNEVLCTGPTIQDDLFTILLRFRIPRYVFTADIEKMYRQIMVAEPDRKYQLILWRNHPSEEIKYYKLNTVTYGTTSAPYLATRCLQELADQSMHRFPSGAAALKYDFYMDDVMSGADNLCDVIEKQEQLRTILSSAGFKLRKWCANHKMLLQHVPNEDQALILDLDNEGQVKTLGLIWTPLTDQFKIRSVCNDSEKVTKRTALSDIAHLFDPLGLMSPVTVVAKIFLQRLWSLKIAWDAALPAQLHSEWLKFRKNLGELNKITIPRHVTGGKIPRGTQLHVFADASEKAYGAVAYIRATHADSTRTVHILCAKSKVAPLKTITIPRLELCAAKLAAELVHRLKRALSLPDRSCFFWTDSEIVLNWIHAEAASFHTFVANRVATIQQLSLPSQWRHVRSEHNPADIVSRGLAPEALKNCSLWFYGPVFLHGSEDSWPKPHRTETIDLEKRCPRAVLAAVQTSTQLLSDIDHRNSLKRLQRIMAYTLRFIKNARRMEGIACCTLQLSAKELEEALYVVIKEAQREEYHDSLHRLKTTKQLSNSESLSSLHPFLDSFGLIRVGGRLEHSNLPYDTKHPIILPYGHPITKLILEDIHQQHLHAGPQALLTIARQKFWPIKGKTAARSVVQKCIRCTRAKPKLLTQLMGELPAQRVQPARPFVNSGVDFAGPLWTHFKIRGKRPQKSYLAVFCCFATKAIHFELVSDLSTESFIAALKRFMGRRGHCRHLYCDNATNFVGAKNQLSELKCSIYEQKAQQKITSFCGSKGIDFHFIPPRSPHFGGLWEAAVKSAKHLLIKNVAPASLTYEELATVLIEVEAVLNSRPLTPLSEDANDLSALTPGHFLIGEPLTTPIDTHALPNCSTLPKRWKQIHDIKQKFWQRWSLEYLTELQQRHKWKQTCENVRPGMLVVIKEDNLPVLKWRMGRISQVIKGSDGLARVADIRTANGVLRRPIHKLAPLPIETEETCSEDVPNKRPPKHKSTDDTSPLLGLSITDTSPGRHPVRPKNRRIDMTTTNLLLWNHPELNADENVHPPQTLL